MNEMTPRDALPLAESDAPAAPTTALSRMLNPEYLQQLSQFSERIAGSQLIPHRFQNKPQDLFIALHLAGQMNVDWLQLVQNLYVVHGSPGFSAKFCVAQANASGVFQGPIRYRVVEADKEIDFRFKKAKDSPWETRRIKNFGITAYALPRGQDEEVSFTVDMKMASAEGWGANPKYLSMPQLMLRYRAATFLIRTHAPEILFGYTTTEEIEDMAAAGTLERVPAAERVEATTTLTDLGGSGGLAERIQEAQERETPPPPTQGTREGEKSPPAASETASRAGVDPGFEGGTTAAPETEPEEAPEPEEPAAAQQEEAPPTPQAPPEPTPPDVELTPLEKALHEIEQCKTADEVDVTYDAYVEQVTDAEVEELQAAAMNRVDQLEQGGEGPPSEESPEKVKQRLMREITQATSLMRLEEIRGEIDNLLAGTGPIKGSVTKALSMRIREIRTARERNG